jgi:hypothetical protein
MVAAHSLGNLQPRFCGFEACDPGNLSPSHQAVDVVRALVRVNWLQIAERL